MIVREQQAPDEASQPAGPGRPGLPPCFRVTVQAAPADGPLALAFFVSVSVSLIFGVYPAVRASGLDPVYALHDEQVADVGGVPGYSRSTLRLFFPDGTHSIDLPTGMPLAAGAEDLPTGVDAISTEEADVEAPPRAVVREGRTFESFRSRDFTLFWLGSIVSNTGSWMQNTALALVVFGLRKSPLDLGIVSFVSGIPVLFMALPAGLLADRVDKRKLLIVCQAALLLQAAALGVLAYGGHLSALHPIRGLVWVSALGLIGGVMSALTFPAWQALLPTLVPRGGLMNAIALNSAQFQSSRLLGPLATSAFVLAGAGMGHVFMVNAASFLFVIAALWAIRPRTDADPRRAGERVGASGPESAWSRLTAGVRYAREHRTVGALIVSTAFMTVFAMPYMMLLPAVVHGALGSTGHVADVQVSWLMSASGLGALIGALVVASLPETVRRERLIPFSIMAMAVVLVALSRSRVFWLTLPLSALAGAGFLTTNSLANTSIQATVPGRLRGRVMGLYVMAFLGIMPFSAALFGPLGEAIGATNAVGAGALVLAGWGVFLAARRSLNPPAHVSTPRE